MITIQSFGIGNNKWQKMRCPVRVDNRPLWTKRVKEAEDRPDRAHRRDAARPQYKRNSVTGK
jgi:hypothetical protein